jgi:hypothetical protein
VRLGRAVIQSRYSVRGIHRNNAAIRAAKIVPEVPVNAVSTNAGCPLETVMLRQRAVVGCHTGTSLHRVVLDGLPVLPFDCSFVELTAC